MKHESYLHAIPPAAAFPSVYVMNFGREHDIDMTPYHSMVAEKGKNETEKIVSRVLEDIAVRLDDLQLNVASHEFKNITRQARRIQQVAMGIGLLDVQNIAANVGIAAAQQDGVAVDAIVSRLERAFEAVFNLNWSDRVPAT